MRTSNVPSGPCWSAGKTKRPQSRRLSRGWAGECGGWGGGAPTGGAESKGQLRRATRPGRLLLDGQPDRLGQAPVSRWTVHSSLTHAHSARPSQEPRLREITHGRFDDCHVVSASRSRSRQPSSPPEPRLPGLVPLPPSLPLHTLPPQRQTR